MTDRVLNLCVWKNNPLTHRALRLISSDICITQRNLCVW